MIRNAIITKVNGRNERGQYTYEAQWTDDEVPCTIRVAPRGRGYDSYLVDDVVMVGLPQGDHTAGRILALVEGAGQLQPDNEANTELRGREDGSVRILAEGSGGRVDLGEGDPGDQEKMGLHAQLRDDIDAIYELLDADPLSPLGKLLLAIQVQILAAGGATIAGDITAFDGSHASAAPDSNPASNVYAKAGS